MGDADVLGGLRLAKGRGEREGGEGSSPLCHAGELLGCQVLPGRGRGDGNERSPAFLVQLRGDGLERQRQERQAPERRGDVGLSEHGSVGEAHEPAIGPVVIAVGGDERERDEGAAAVEDAAGLFDDDELLGSGDHESRLQRGTMSTEAKLWGEPSTMRS